MAFRQPVVALRRPEPLQEPQYNGPTIQIPAQQSAHDELREWVLFPPSQAYSTSQTRTSFTAHTPQTAGHSRISDFGSIGITAHSDGNERDLARDSNDDAAKDEDELDSLDEGLHAFHDPTLDRYTRFLGRSGTILPTHDGLGMFPPSSLQVQEHLWQFEQHNPRKRTAGAQLLSSSLRRHLDTTAADDDDAAKLDSERRQRIENWRIDQARLLLNEIEKQSRRMRRSQSSGQRDPCASAGSVARGVGSAVADSMHQHEGGGVEGGGGDKQQESGSKETLLEGITRRLCDLLGIDDFLLSIIFGDALPADESASRLASSSLPELDSSANQPTVSSLLPEGHGRLLDRLTRELGLVIQKHLSEHPGAFSTHSHLADGPDISTPSASLPWMNQEQPERSLPLHDFDNTSSSSFSSPHFIPTLQRWPEPVSSPSKSEAVAAAAAAATNAALWGVEEDGNNNTNNNNPFQLSSIAEERAYWERTPDVKSIFRLLHTRFTTTADDDDDEHKQHLSPPSPSLTKLNPSKNIPITCPNTITTTTTTILASLRRRASVICQHHPLVSKGDRHSHGPSSRRTTRNSFLPNHHHHHHHHNHTHHNNNRQMFSLLLHRAASSNNSKIKSKSNNNSCTSSNLCKGSRKAAAAAAAATASGTSSRNYWDLDLGACGAGDDDDDSDGDYDSGGGDATAVTAPSSMSKAKGKAKGKAKAKAKDKK